VTRRRDHGDILVQAKAVRVRRHTGDVAGLEHDDRHRDRRGCVIRAHPDFFGASRPWVFVAIPINLLLIAALLVVSRRKTDGEWRWRWGK
jgi:hypothetical protein